MSEEKVFNFPEVGGTYLGRAISVACGGGTTWAAVQMEQARRNTIALVSQTGDARTAIELATPSQCHRPHVVACPDGGAVVVWNEHGDGRWRIEHVRVGRNGMPSGDIQTVAESSDLILPPSAAFLGEDLWACWPAVVDDRLRIHAACLSRPSGRPEPISPPDVDAFRPSLAAGGDTLFVAWDQYRDGIYQVAVAGGDDPTWQPLATLDGPSAGHEGERWFCPRVVADPEGTAYVVWTVLGEVTDELGIIDHFPFAMAAKVDGGGVQILHDAANPASPRIAADLREGLLASTVYKGYLGLRRNPQLSIADDGRLWCLWETRLEAEESHRLGRLAARRLGDDASWGPTRIVHEGPYCYSVAPAMTGGRLPVAFIRFDEAGLDRIGIEELDLAGGDAHEPDPTRWERWRPVVVRPPAIPRPTTEIDDTPHRLFWADTHCHSNVSADAEGEVDELVHFGRDVAGLDAMCVIDNDYYPHKALTEAEWQVHQALCRHFTEEGRFVLFPGWEFTFHREDLSPSFNHRCIVFPRPGGQLWRRIDPESRMDRGLLERLAGSGCMVYPHHPTYELLDPQQEWNVEVCSSWRVCLEETDHTMQMLREGHRFGFIGSSDTHRAVPGLGGALTGLYATGLTPEALFDAYRCRRTVATQGFFAHIEFRVGGAFIGSELTHTGPPAVEAVVEAPATIEFVEVIRDGESVYRVTPEAASCRIAFADSSAAVGEHFYFLRLKLVGDSSFNSPLQEGELGPFSVDSRYPHNLARARGVWAWTSPIWVTVT